MPNNGQNALNRNIDHHSSYESIVSLYDVAEELIEKVNDASEDFIEEVLDGVEPLVEVVEESTEVLTNEYLLFANPAADPRLVKKNNVESALRKIFAAISDYKARGGSSEAVTKFMEKYINPIVEKLKNVAEEVIAVFLEVVALSVDKILHKLEIDDLKKKNQRIAVLLGAQHNLAYQHT
jgi:histone H3/H4